MYLRENEGGRGEASKASHQAIIQHMKQGPRCSRHARGCGELEPGRQPAMRPGLAALQHRPAPQATRPGHWKVRSERRPGKRLRGWGWAWVVAGRRIPPKRTCRGEAPGASAPEWVDETAAGTGSSRGATPACSVPGRPRSWRSRRREGVELDGGSLDHSLCTDPYEPYRCRFNLLTR
jgi:hypothetical protein